MEEENMPFSFEISAEKQKDEMANRNQMHETLL